MIENLDRKIEMFLYEYEMLCKNYRIFKKDGNIELAKIVEAKRHTLAWVLIELGFKKEVINIQLKKLQV